MNDEDRRKLRGGLIPDKYLVPLKVFLNNSIYQRLLNEDVLDRILKAFYVETNRNTSMINQYQFLALNAFLRFNTLNEAQLITIWCRIFDPISCGRITYAECRTLIESLTRGTLTSGQTLVSQMFEDGMITRLTNSKCLTDEKFLEIPRLKKVM